MNRARSTLHTNRRTATTLAFTGLALTSLCAGACADGDAAHGDGGTTASATSGGTSMGAATTEASETADADTTSSSSGGETSSGRVAASGVRVAWVEANQGVGIRLGEEAVVVPPSERDAKLLADRPLLLRAGWATDGGFSPHAIAAELRLRDADGSEVRLVDVREVGAEEPSLPWTTTFQWRLEAERLDEDTEYRIELYEADPAADPSLAPEVPPSFPPGDAFAPFGLERSPHRLEITLVPIAYDDGLGCVTQPELDDEDIAYLRSQLYMVHPVQEVSITVSEPLAFEGPLEQWSDLNDRLSEFRTAESMPVQQYLEGMVDLCGATPEDVNSGVYGLIDRAAAELAFARVGAANWISREFNARTLTKHLGTLQGRKAVSCDGTAHEDPDYPDATGSIVHWGWGVLDGGLRDPSVHADIMARCTPWWMSMYGWAALEPFIAEVSSWTVENDAPPTEGELLVLRIAGDGRTSWTRIPGSLGGAADPEAVVAIETDGGTEPRRALRIDDAEGEGYRIITELEPSELARSLIYTPEVGDEVELRVPSRTGQSQ